MNSRPPKLRSDLESRPPAANEAAWVVKDPLGEEYYRFQEVERFIADQLDGETPLDAIRLRAEEKFQAALAPEALASFVASLARNGLLESGPEERPRRSRKRGRLAGGLLSLRYRLFDPEPLLNLLVRKTSFFFTPGFVAVATALIAAGIGVCIFEWDGLVRDAASLFRLSAIPLVLACVFAVVSAHEFAHGLTCRHFGGRVREMGFMVLYFQPTFYCDVSDAWLFPQKSRRLWVGFAGPFFELFLWALAALAWRATDPDTWINQAALVVTATSGVKTIFNFNPLLKLDGYYLLSDWLDIPNLRKKSFAYLGDWLKTLGGLLGPRPEAAPREHRIFMAYGVTAWIVSMGFMIYGGLVLGGYLVAQGQQIAFLSFLGLLGFRFRRKMSKLAGGAPAEPAPRRPKSRGRRRFLWLAAAGALAALLFGVHVELRVAGSVTVLPEHNADVRSEIDGVIEEILVDEGQRVAQGGLVARLSGREYAAELQKTDAEIRQVRARLDLLAAGPTPKEVEVARRVIAGAEDRVAFAKARRGRSESLFKDDLVSLNEVEYSRELETDALNTLAEAKSRLQLLQEGSRPEEIRAAEAERSRLEAQRAFLQSQMERLDVFSPAAGVVITPSRQLAGLVRQAVAKGGLIAKVHELRIVVVEAIVSEKEIADVKIGQTAAVKTRAHPDRVFQGTVTSVAPAAQGTGVTDSTGPAASGSSPGGNDRPATMFRVLTEIDNREGLLKPGMTGMIKIDCGERRVVDLVVRRLSRTFRVEFWSWW